jgi:serpin B
VVDESGTEAAAATGGATKTNAVIDNHVTIDKPFYAALRDRGTGEVLFLAAVRDPR